MDEVKPKLNIHKLLRKQVSFAEDAEAIDTANDKGDEEDVNKISGASFQ